MITPGIFKANDIRGRAVQPDPDWDAAGAAAIGAAWVDVSGLRPGVDSLVIGRDMRITSPEMAAAFAGGVAGRGVDVIDIGLASTDQLWYASGALGLPGAMFTASHNPAPDNGIKFCRAGALPVAARTGYLPDQIALHRDLVPQPVWFDWPNNAPFDHGARLLTALQIAHAAIQDGWPGPDAEKFADHRWLEHADIMAVYRALYDGAR